MTTGPRHRTLEIETGVDCPNRCVFCYQKGYRDHPSAADRVSTAEIVGRLRQGAAAGFTEVSFVGGEPTLRRDFLDLVRQARSLGFEHATVTTNGWRLARPEFFDAAIEAGLSSIGVSIHGPDAATHDGLTGREGSFDRAVQAVRNAVASPARPRLNAFTLVNRRNASRLLDTARMLRGLGVRLMVFQPVLLSKANFEGAAGVRLPIGEVVGAVRAVAAYAVRSGFRVKPFNLPPCLFHGVLDGLDLERYEISTRRDDRGSGTGHVRLDACRDCALTGACPGLHVTLLPEEDVIAHLAEGLSSLGPGAGRAVWIPGTDLLGDDGLATLVNRARGQGFSKVIVTNGGTCLWGRGDPSRMAIVAPDEVVLVLHETDPASGDRSLARAGNRALLEIVAGRLAGAARETRLNIGVLVSPGSEAEDFLATTRVREAAIPGSVHVRLEGSRPRWDAIASLHRAIRRIGVERVEVFAGPAVGPAGLASMAMHTFLGGGRMRFDAGAAMVPTAFHSPGLTSLNWSLPELDRGGAPLPIVCSALPVAPFRTRF